MFGTVTETRRYDRNNFKPMGWMRLVLNGEDNTSTQPSSSLSPKELDKECYAYFWVGTTHILMSNSHNAFDSSNISPPDLPGR